MGDKSPKSNQKNAGQKKAKAAIGADQKKKNDEAAKAAAKPKK